MRLAPRDEGAGSCPGAGTHDRPRLAEDHDRPEPLSVQQAQRLGGRSVLRDGGYAAADELRGELCSWSTTRLGTPGSSGAGASDRRPARAAGPGPGRSCQCARRASLQLASAITAVSFWQFDSEFRPIACRASSAHDPQHGGLLMRPRSVTEQISWHAEKEVRWAASARPSCPRRSW